MDDADAIDAKGWDAELPLLPPDRSDGARGNGGRTVSDDAMSTVAQATDVQIADADSLPSATPIKATKGLASSPDSTVSSVSFHSASSAGAGGGLEPAKQSSQPTHRHKPTCASAVDAPTGAARLEPADPVLPNTNARVDTALQTPPTQVEAPQRGLGGAAAATATAGVAVALRGAEGGGAGLHRAAEEPNSAKCHVDHGRLQLQLPGLLRAVGPGTPPTRSAPVSSHGHNSTQPGGGGSGVGRRSAAGAVTCVLCRREASSVDHPQGRMFPAELLIHDNAAVRRCIEVIRRRADMRLCDGCGRSLLRYAKGGRQTARPRVGARNTESSDAGNLPNCRGGAQPAACPAPSGAAGPPCGRSRAVRVPNAALTGRHARPMCRKGKGRSLARKRARSAERHTPVPAAKSLSKRDAKRAVLVARAMAFLECLEAIEERLGMQVFGPRMWQAYGVKEASGRPGAADTTITTPRGGASPDAIVRRAVAPGAGAGAGTGAGAGAGAGAGGGGGPPGPDARRVVMAAHTTHPVITSPTMVERHKRRRHRRRPVYVPAVEDDFDRPQPCTNPASPRVAPRATPPGASAWVPDSDPAESVGAFDCNGERIWIPDAVDLSEGLPLGAAPGVHVAARCLDEAGNSVTATDYPCATFAPDGEFGLPFPRICAAIPLVLRTLLHEERPYTLEWRFLGRRVARTQLIIPRDALVLPVPVGVVADAPRGLDELDVGGVPEFDINEPGGGGGGGSGVADSTFADSADGDGDVDMGRGWHRRAADDDGVWLYWRPSSRGPVAEPEPPHLRLELGDEPASVKSRVAPRATHTAAVSRVVSTAQVDVGFAATSSHRADAVSTASSAFTPRTDTCAPTTAVAKAGPTWRHLAMSTGLWLITMMVYSMWVNLDAATCQTIQGLGASKDPWLFTWAILPNLLLLQLPCAIPPALCLVMVMHHTKYPGVGSADPHQTGKTALLVILQLLAQLVIKYQWGNDSIGPLLVCNLIINVVVSFAWLPQFRLWALGFGPHLAVYMVLIAVVFTTPKFITLDGASLAFNAGPLVLRTAELGLAWVLAFAMATTQQWTIQTMSVWARFLAAMIVGFELVMLTSPDVTWANMAGTIGVAFVTDLVLQSNLWFVTSSVQSFAKLGGWLGRRFVDSSADTRTRHGASRMHDRRRNEYSYTFFNVYLVCKREAVVPVVLAVMSVQLLGTTPFLELADCAALGGVLPASESAKSCLRLIVALVVLLLSFFVSRAIRRQFAGSWISRELVGDATISREAQAPAGVPAWLVFVCVAATGLLAYSQLPVEVARALGHTTEVPGPVSPFA